MPALCVNDPMRFLLLLAATVACAQPVPSAGTPVSLVTSDIENFWKAYDASEPGNREAAFQKLYLDAGSAGLKDFVKLRIQSAKALAAAVDQRYPRFYATVRPYTLGVEKQRAAILRSLDRFRELYPQAHFPTVYFVIGRLTSGGTTSSNALLIGTEVNSLGPDVDSTEITPSFRKAMGTADRLPLIVIHELTHTQVNIFGKGKVPGLLGACVNEGAADFMTELVTGASINAHVKEWADPRREELFQRLARDIFAEASRFQQVVVQLQHRGRRTCRPGILDRRGDLSQLLRAVGGQGQGDSRRGYVGKYRRDGTQEPIRVAVGASEVGSHPLAGC